MSRSGYSEDYDNWQNIMYRGAVYSAINSARGQALLHNLLTALDAMPERKLISDELITEDGNVCALGAVGKMRGIDMDGLDPQDAKTVAATFNIAPALAREIVWENDREDRYWSNETPEQRFERMRQWVASLIKPEPTS